MSCKKMIPLYPVRYAVKGKEGAPAYGSQSTLEKNFPSLKKASYTLQTIPAEYYILIVESFGGGTAFRLFHNSTARKGFIEVDWVKYSKGAAPVYKGVAKSYIPINHQVTNLHIGLSEYPITPRMANKLVGSHKTKVMLQEIPVGSWAKTSPSKHTFHVDKLKDVLEEFTNAGDILYHNKLPTFKAKVPTGVATDMKIEYTPEQLDDPKKDKRMVVALHDPVGITEDLNAFVGIQQQKLQEYVAKEGHRYTSGKLVTNYLNNVTPNLKEIEKQKHIAAEKIKQKYKYSRYRGMQTDRALKESAKEITEELRDPLERAYKALKGGKQGQSNIYTHRKKYKEKIKSYEPDILASASDALTWANQIQNGGVVEKHLAIHDHECPASWQYYEKQVHNIIASLINTKQGEAFVFKLIKTNPDDSPLWKALAKGDEMLWEKVLGITNSDYLQKPTEFASKLSDFGVQHETELLSGLLKPFLTKNLGTRNLYLARLSEVLHYRVGYTIVEYKISSAAAYNLAVDYIHDGKNLTGINAKIHKQTVSKTLARTTSVTATKTVPLYTLEKVGEIHYSKYTPLKAPSLGENNPFRKKLDTGLGRLGNVLTVVAAIASGVTLEKTIAKIGNDGKLAKHEIITLSAATASFASAGWGLQGMWKSISANRAGLDLASKNLIKATFIRRAGYAGAIASAIAAISDGVQANQLLKLGDSDAAYSRIASSAFNGAAAFATTAATYTAASAIMGQGAVLLGLGPVGWFVLAVALTGAAIYYATQSDKKTDTPAEFWLKYGPWGLSPKLDKSEETEVFYKAFFKPHVTAKWEDISGADILHLSFYLPQFQKGKSTFEWKKAVSATLGSNKLNPVLFEHNQAYLSKPYDEVDWDKDFRIYEQVQEGNGFRIVQIGIHVDDSAKVNFAYNYYPEGMESGVILTHGKQGMSWDFSDDFFFVSTTDKDKLEILSDKDRLEYIAN